MYEEYQEVELRADDDEDIWKDYGEGMFTGEMKVR